MGGGVFIGLASAFFAVGGFILALFFMFGALCLLLRIYLEFESFVASKFAEDALGHGADGDWPHLPHEIHGSVEVLHRSGDLQ
jgi:hypothetical protein